MKTSEHTGLPLLAQGAVIAHNLGVGTQHLYSAPPRQAVPPPMARVSEATEPHSFQQLMETMQQFMAQQQLMQQQIQAMQQQAVAAAVAEQHRVAASARRQTHALPSFPMTPAVGEYSAGASLPLPPRVQATHRASYGRPSTPAAFIPFTPVAQRAAAAPQVEAKDSLDEDEDDAAADVQAADERMPPLP